MSETIAAQATPPGTGALSIIRLSGENSLTIVNTFFSKNILQSPSHTIHYGKILSSCNEVIDEVVVMIMKEKKSFTGENSVEIICHGNPLITQKILRRCFESGAIAAPAGEFSKRAFQNGKIDLIQAEAIKELIHAKSELALKEASKQLSGKLSIYIKDLQQCFIDLLSIIEVHIDYPEEGIEPTTKKQILELMESTKEKIKNLIDSFHDGKKLASGFNVAILGAPNAGKSSLLNTLLDSNRAIVTDIAGTTRDTIEEEIIINNWLIKFIDTAGIRDTKDTIEKIGIEKSFQAKKEADLSLLLIDITDQIPEEIVTLSKNPNCITVYNKVDLIEKPTNPLNIAHPIYLSTKQGTGIEILIQAIENKLLFNPSKETTIITKERHFHALKECYESLHHSLTGIENQASIEFVAFDLRFGLEKLSSIIGIDITEEILGGIFSNFCVGK